MSVTERALYNELHSAGFFWGARTGRFVSHLQMINIKYWKRWTHQNNDPIVICN